MCQFLAHQYAFGYVWETCFMSIHLQWNAVTGSDSSKSEHFNDKHFPSRLTQKHFAGYPGCSNHAKFWLTLHETAVTPTEVSLSSINVSEFSNLYFGSLGARLARRDSLRDVVTWQKFNYMSWSYAALTFVYGCWRLLRWLTVVAVLSFILYYKHCISSLLTADLFPVSYLHFGKFPVVVL